MTTRDVSDVLFELGTEELPPKALLSLQNSLLGHLKNSLTAWDLTYEAIEGFCAPRRLAVRILNLDKKTRDKHTIRRGPPIARAYLEDGTPSKATLGFAQSLGVSIDALTTLDTDKGQYLGYEEMVEGAPIKELLPALIQEALDALPIPKRMRWGADKNEFIRPVKWVLLMQDDVLMPATFYGKSADVVSYGHRFLSPGEIRINHPREYEDTLKRHYVLVSFEARKAAICNQVDALKEDACAILPPVLLEEIAALVDYPVAQMANFDAAFLEVPQEALILTMQTDQKYICLTDANNRLLPRFIFIANLPSKDARQVILGNEKVVRPRLADAQFFFLQDQKRPLEAFTEKLKTQVCHEGLGTLWDKSMRIASLASFIAHTLKDAGYAVDADATTRAGLLCKADLGTHLVGEFAQMQGIAGGYYARISQESDTVANAIGEHYLPRFANDVLPKTLEGICIALADRLDTLVGLFFAAGAPTGSRDPFGLRRIAIALLRLLIESNLPLNLVVLLQKAIFGYKGAIDDDTLLTSVMDFINGRYRAMYEGLGMRLDAIMAAGAMHVHMPLDFDARVRALDAFFGTQDGATLVAMLKRVDNLLQKTSKVQGDINPAHFVEDAERALFDAIKETKKAVEAPLQRADYKKVLGACTHLKAPLADFFDGVMINADDAHQRQNRLLLLKEAKDLLTLVGDLGAVDV